MRFYTKRHKHTCGIDQHARTMQALRTGAGLRPGALLVHHLIPRSGGARQLARATRTELHADSSDELCRRAHQAGVRQTDRQSYTVMGRSLVNVQRLCPHPSPGITGHQPAPHDWDGRRVPMCF